MECNHIFKRILNEHSHSLLNECHTIQSKLKYIFTNVITLKELIQLIHRDYYRSKQQASKNLDQFWHYLRLADQLFYYRLSLSSSWYHKCLHYYQKALLDCRDDILKSRIYYSMATLFTFQSNQSLKNGRQKQQRLALQSINQAIEILENSSSLSNSSKLLLNKCYEFFNQLCCRQQPNTIEKLMENKNWKLNHFGFLFEFDENCSIFYNKQKGRYLKTLTKNKMNSIPYGTHIIRERAISIILDSNQYHHYCSNCYRRLSLSTMIFFPCHYCHQIVFCSRKCEQKANTHGGLHRFECKLISILQSNHYGWHLFRMIQLIGGYKNFIKWSIIQQQKQRCFHNDDDDHHHHGIVHRNDSIINIKVVKQQPKPYYNYHFIEQINQFRLKYEDNDDDDDVERIKKNDEKSKKGGSNQQNTAAATKCNKQDDDDGMEINSLNYYSKLLSLIDSFCLPSNEDDDNEQQQQQQKWNSFGTAKTFENENINDDDGDNNKFDSTLILLLWALKIIIMATTINITNGYDDDDDEKKCKIFVNKKQNGQFEMNKNKNKDHFDEQEKTILETNFDDDDNKIKWPNKFTTNDDDNNNNNNNDDDDGNRQHNNETNNNNNYENSERNQSKVNGIDDDDDDDDDYNIFNDEDIIILANVVNKSIDLMKKFSFNLFGWCTDDVYDDDDDEENENVCITSLNNNNNNHYSMMINQSKQQIMINEKNKIIGNCLGLWTAMINHSCDPNAYWDIDQGGYITITTASKIEPNTEINISYGIYANDYNFNERQQYLWKRYRFHCQCNACLKQQQQQQQEQEQQTLTEFIQNDKNSID
ncbi:uncharacterized protein LOC142644917 isoform X2 [Dermatophagoides pteronyssinus]|uniref:uncharacterized protein LOC142644917 isoform X2 n=1 Tax=Dermatophagoides pteronyssinus TaxID=6956 RepID=UPI003F67C7FA